MVEDHHVETFQRDGVVCVRGLISPDWIAVLREAVEEVMVDKGPDARDVAEPGKGRFFTDIYMHRRNEKFRQMIFESGVGRAAGSLLKSNSVRLYNDHLLVKEPGTDALTPWHQDLPYFRADGTKLASFWIGLDPVTKSTGAMSFVKGSHRWGKMFRPVSFTNGSQVSQADPFDGPPPNVDAEPSMEQICYEMEPGDVTFHHVLTLHSAQGNASESLRRRALSLRLAGDDIVWLRRAFSPSGLESGLNDGDPLGGPMFPVLWERETAAA
jgi:ectoine hydroxylase-related dioxygenase (phytanoyl-CoA dioxygenase family)